MSEKKTSEKLKQFLSHDWFIKLEPFFDSIAMENIINYLTIKKNSGKIIYPKQSDIFNAFKYCSFENTKVVIIGQD